MAPERGTTVAVEDPTTERESSEEPGTERQKTAATDQLYTARGCLKASVVRANASTKRNLNSHDGESRRKISKEVALDSARSQQRFVKEAKASLQVRSTRDPALATAEA